MLPATNDSLTNDESEWRFVGYTGTFFVYAVYERNVGGSVERKYEFVGFFGGGLGEQEETPESP